MWKCVSESVSSLQCVPDQPEQQDDLQYASVHNRADPLYSNMRAAQPLRHTEQQEVPVYAAVKFSSAAPRWADPHTGTLFTYHLILYALLLPLRNTSFISQDQRTGPWRGSSCIVQHGQQIQINTAFEGWYFSFFQSHFYLQGNMDFLNTFLRVDLSKNEAMSFQPSFY